MVDTLSMPETAVDAQRDVLAREAEVKRLLDSIQAEKKALGIKRTRYTAPMAGRDALIGVVGNIIEAARSALPEGIELERIVLDVSLSDNVLTKVNKARTYLHNPNAKVRTISDEQKLVMKAGRKLAKGETLTKDEKAAWDAAQKAKAEKAAAAESNMS